MILLRYWRLFLAMRLRFCIHRKHAIISPCFYHISCQFTRKWIANKKAIMQKPESRWQERKTCLRVNYKIIRTAILIIFRRNFTVRESENQYKMFMLTIFIWIAQLWVNNHVSWIISSPFRDRKWKQSM